MGLSMNAGNRFLAAVIGGHKSSRQTIDIVGKTLPTTFEIGGNTLPTTSSKENSLGRVAQ